MESSRRALSLVPCGLVVLLISLFSCLVGAQGLPPLPYRTPPAMRGGLDLAPSNPVGIRGSVGACGSDSFYLNSGMFRDILPLIPNLEIGYLYQFGNVIRTGRLTLDYVLPARAASDQALFGEAHAEFTNFGKTIQRMLGSGDTTTTYRGLDERTDLSFGGGYRNLLNPSLMLGVNGFYDTSKLGTHWYDSGGVGLEMAALGPGYGLVELSFNYYGELFQGRNSIINAFRKGPGNFDISARYSIELGDCGPDLRLKATGYQFDTGTKQYGVTTEAELRTRNGMFSVKAGTGHDPVNGWYHTVGGFVNMGLNFANLLRAESPFEMPEPIFRSPRNLRRLLTQKVDRNYISPPATAARTHGAQGGGGGGCPPCGDPGLGTLVYTSPPIRPGYIPPSQSTPCDPTVHFTFQQSIHYIILICVSSPYVYVGPNPNVDGFGVYFYNDDLCADGYFGVRLYDGCTRVYDTGTWGPSWTWEAVRFLNESTTGYDPGTVIVMIYTVP